MWDFVLSMLVILHLVTEYIHYVLEYFSGKRDEKILSEIQYHRSKSTKTEKLIMIQKDIDLIKAKLKIEEE